MIADPETVLGALGGGVPLYAVLDCARNRTMHPWLHGTRAPAWCLYRGELPLELRAAAPHLLRVGRGHDYARQLVQLGWGQSWGVYFASQAPVRELRRHLRRFLRAQTEDGRIFVFRYYDPRVLRVFLPTCTPAELDQFFGPIEAFVAEGEDPAELHLYRLSGGALEQSVLPAAPPAVAPAAVAAPAPVRRAARLHA